MSSFTREEAVIHAEASARIEGVILDQETQAIMGRWANGDCSSAELDEWLQQQLAAARQEADAELGAKLLG